MRANSARSRINCHVPLLIVLSGTRLVTFVWGTCAGDARPEPHPPALAGSRRLVQPAQRTQRCVWCAAGHRQGSLVMPPCESKIQLTSYWQAGRPILEASGWRPPHHANHARPRTPRGGASARRRRPTPLVRRVVTRDQRCLSSLAPALQRPEASGLVVPMPLAARRGLSRLPPLFLIDRRLARVVFPVVEALHVVIGPWLALWRVVGALLLDTLDKVHPEVVAPGWPTIGAHEHHVCCFLTRGLGTNLIWSPGSAPE